MMLTFQGWRGSFCRDEAVFNGTKNLLKNLATLVDLVQTENASEIDISSERVTSKTFVVNSSHSRIMSKSPYKASSNGYGGESLGLFGETIVPETIKIEHVFTLKLSDKWERPLRKWIDKWFDLSKDYAESFHLIAAGIGSYFFFLGVSKVVKAGRISDNNSDDSSSSITKRNKTKNKDKNKDNAATATVSSSLSRKTKTNDTPITTISTIPKTTTEEVPTSDSHNSREL